MILMVCCQEGTGQCAGEDRGLSHNLLLDLLTGNARVESACTVWCTSQIWPLPVIFLRSSKKIPKAFSISRAKDQPKNYVGGQPSL